MKQDKGFSLIELLIVVAIIGIIAAIAIPNFTTSRIAANEASAISAVRTICTAQITYATTLGNGTFASSLGQLSGTTPPLIDTVLASGVKSGYNVSTGATGNVGFTVGATPVSQGVTGWRTFTTDQIGVIYANGAVLN